MRVRATGLVVPAIFAVAAVMTGVTAENRIATAVAHPGTRTWLMAVYAMLRTAVSLAFAIFTIGRSTPRQRARSPLAFAACIVAMGAVTVFGDPPARASDSQVLFGDVIAVASCAWLVFAVSYLGRCFGVLPEARGLVTRGPYAIVRHPVYLGEIGACVGLALAAPTGRNLVLLVAFMAGQAIRMRYEEAALTDAFPEYVNYARRVPRLIPSPRAMAGYLSPPRALDTPAGD